MADVKKLQTRIALKYDSYANWTDDTKEGLGANLVLLKGEIGLCEIPSGNSSATTAPTVLFKVGDGETPFKTLKWASALAADVYGWAKASDVVLEGKTIKFVDTDKTITLEYLTEAEINAKIKVVSDSLAGVDARVVALEGKFGTDDGTVDKKIEALEGRMTTAEGDIDTLESTKLDASVFTAFNDGTSKKVSEIEADIVAKANAAKAGAEKTASDALAAAVKTLNEKDAALVAEDSRLAGLIGDNKTAIEKEVTDRGTAITNVTNAYTTAIGNAKTELEGKITAEETARTNAINTLTQTVNTNAGTVTSEIARVEGLVTSEASKRAEEDGKLDGRLQKVEAFFEGAYTEDGQPVKEALDTLVEIQNFITGDGEAASALLDAIEANATAIENLEGRVDTAEDDIDALEGRATALEGRMDTADGDIADLKTASAKHAEKTYVDTELAKYVKTADYTTDKTTTTKALNDRYTKSEADDKFATITTVNDNTTEIGKNAAAIAKNASDISTNTTAIGTEKTRAEGEEAKIRGEFAAADLEITNKIGDVGTGTVAAAISAAQAAAQGYADTQVNALKTGDVAKNTSDISAVSGRVDAIEEKYMGWFVIDCGTSTTVIDETK